MSDSETSGFVPQSLLDTIQGPSRTYTSARAPLSRAASTNHHHPRPSHAHQASVSITAREKKEREAAAKEDAAAMSRMLGLDTPPSQATPRPPVATTSASEGDVSRMRATLADKDSEIASLRRQAAGLAKEKAELARKVERLEREATTAKGAGNGLGARELEELERSFSTQEALLAGYQKDAERSMITIEGLKKQNTRMSQFLERLYGPTWETDLASHLSRPAVSNLPIPLPPTSSSPILRSGPRPSIQTITHTLHTPHTSSFSSSSPSPSPLPTDPDDRLSSSPTSLTPLDPALSPEALKEHLESIQTLLRGMERRLIAREVQLEAQEKRARDEAAVAKTRWEEWVHVGGEVRP